MLKNQFSIDFTEKENILALDGVLSQNNFWTYFTEKEMY
jgi:hypothetical protein